MLVLKPRGPERAALTVTAEVTSEGSFVEPMSTGLPVRSNARVWIGACAFLAILGIGAAWAIAPSRVAPKEPPPLEAAVPAPIDPLPIAPPPPPVAPEPIVEAPAPEQRPAPVAKKSAKKKRRAKRAAAEGPKRVDGVPLLENPGF